MIIQNNIDPLELNQSLLNYSTKRINWCKRKL